MTFHHAKVEQYLRLVSSQPAANLKPDEIKRLERIDALLDALQWKSQELREIAEKVAIEFGRGDE